MLKSSFNAELDMTGITELSHNATMLFMTDEGKKAATRLEKRKPRYGDFDSSRASRDLPASPGTIVRVSWRSFACRSRRRFRPPELRSLCAKG
jgi:hypothetical protein